MAASPMKMITLEASGGEIFQIDEIVLHQFRKIRHMIEDGRAQGVIPLPNVRSRTLSKVIEYCKKHLEPLAEEELKSWDAEFVKVDNDFLCELIELADYLGIEELAYLTCETLANIVKNGSLEPFRRFFFIEREFTPEEEAEARKKIGW